jgi:hypothetical protein
MGPSQSYAFAQAEIALGEIKSFLMTKYRINVFPGVTDIVSTSHLEEEQIDNFKVLDGLIKEIFWTDACIAF